MSDTDGNTTPPAATPATGTGPEIPVNRATDHQPPQTQPQTVTPPQNPSRDDAIMTALSALPEKMLDAFKTMSQPAPPPPTDEVKAADKVETKVEEAPKRRTFADIWFG